MLAWHNGTIIPYEEAHVHVSDLGLLRAYAVFDYLRTFGGRPFRLHDHLARFRNSAAGLGIPLRFANEQIAAAIDELLARNPLEECAFRLVLTGGHSPDSMTISDPNFFILAERLPEYDPVCYTEGVKLITSEFLRDVPTVKSTGYLNAIRLAPIVREHGAHDMLYCHEGRVLELTRNNFFLFHGDTLATPSDDVLHGITRKVVLELCRGAFPVEERDVRTDELRAATEAFLCGTTKGVMPVVRIDDFVVGEGRVGENTRRVMELFGAYTARK